MISNNSKRISVVQKLRASLGRIIPIRVEVDRSITDYVAKNPGFSFLLTFMMLAFFCMISIIRGNATLANQIIVYGYYVLVGAVAIQIISILRKADGSCR